MIRVYTASHNALLPILLLGLLLAACTGTTPASAPSPETASDLRSAVVTPLAQVTIAPAAAPTATPRPVIAPTETLSDATPTVTLQAPAAAPTSLPSGLTPTSEPRPTPEPEPAAAEAVVAADLLNVRGGPGTEYPIVGQALPGERYPIVGRNVAGDWWRIDFDGLDGWVYEPLVIAEGDVAAVAVLEDVAPPAPPVAPAVQVYETTIAIPTYPWRAFTQEASNPDFNWTYRRFDREAYLASNPQPLLQSYTAIVLENEYLRLTLLPDLGGRIYEVIFKPTGSNETYKNPVIKPSPWGPPEQLGWLAAGGIEWDLPVEEHGYAWGDSWGYILLPFDANQATVTVFMPYEDHIRAEVDVTLRAGEAAFTLQPRIDNPTEQPVDTKFWINAMLAPGPANTVGPDLRWLFPTGQMTVHSRGDESLPAEQQPLSWPMYQGRDLSRLGNWRQFLGFFERPAAHGPYAGVYDEATDEGMLRVFSAAAAHGSKGFGLGWSAALPAELYTDDESAYVELHGGVAPTFWETVTLAAGATYGWSETWFPVAGIGGVSDADGNGAAYLAPAEDGLLAGLFPIREVAGRLLVTVDGQPLLDEDATISPARPFRRVLPAEGLPDRGRVAITLLDGDSAPVLAYEQELALR